MYWGTARWTPYEIMDAYTNCRQFNCITPVVEQTEYHMFCREKAELYMPETYNKIGENIDSYIYLLKWQIGKLELGTAVRCAPNWSSTSIYEYIHTYVRVGIYLFVTKRVGKLRYRLNIFILYNS